MSHVWLISYLKDPESKSYPWRFPCPFAIPNLGSSSSGQVRKSLDQMQMEWCWAALRSTDWTTVGGCWWCWWMLIPRDDWEYLKRGVEMVEACWNHQSTILVTFYHPEFGDENFGWELFIDSGVWPVSCGRNQELQSQVGQLELTSSGFWWFCRSCGASKMGGMKPTPSTHMQPPILFLIRYTWSSSLSFSLSLSTGKNQYRSSDWSDHKDLVLNKDYIVFSPFSHLFLQLWSWLILASSWPQESELQNERGVSTELRHVTEELKQKVAAPLPPLLAIFARKTPHETPRKGKNMPVKCRCYPSFLL